jgi:hypothetical protein
MVVRHAPSPELKAAFDRLTDSINMMQVAERFLTPWNPKLKSGACPKCGGKDRWHVNHSNLMLWACRGCHPRYGDAIEFYRWYYGMPFWEAVRTLEEHVNGGAVQRTTRTVLQNQKVETVKEWKKPEWQSIVRSIVESSKVMLAKSPALPYLHQRGFTDSTIADFDLGYQRHGGNRDCVTIPWRYLDNTVTSLKFRFFDEAARDKRRRFTSHAGGEQILFGSHLWQGHEMLIMVEGEMNAMSLYQMAVNAGLPVDVGSFGGEDNKQHLVDVCKASKKTMLWYDNEVKLAKAMQIIEENHVSGVLGITNDQDANDILVKLGEQALYDVILKSLF